MLFLSRLIDVWKWYDLYKLCTFLYADEALSVQIQDEIYWENFKTAQEKLQQQQEAVKEERQQQELQARSMGGGPASMVIMLYNCACHSRFYKCEQLIVM